MNGIPTRGGNGQLTIVDSEINEMEPWGEARVIIRNSKVSVIHASDQTEVWAYDSIVEYDVVARDQAAVHLFNTQVRGKITEADGGKVYVD